MTPGQRKPENEKLSRRWDGPSSPELDDKVQELADIMFEGRKIQALRYIVKTYFEMIENRESDE